jgi:hypothetical protein
MVSHKETKITTTQKNTVRASLKDLLFFYAIYNDKAIKILAY